MAEKKKKNKPAATTRMSTKKQAGYSLATSPRFKTIAKKVDDGKITTAEAIDMLLPKDLKGEERNKARVKLAQAIGSQNANRYIAETDQMLNEKHAKMRKKTTQSRKPAMAYGGMAKGFKKGGYANCGASVKATQKSTMACGGMATHKK